MYEVGHSIMMSSDGAPSIQPMGTCILLVFDHRKGWQTVSSCLLVFVNGAVQDWINSSCVMLCELNLYLPLPAWPTNDARTANRKSSNLLL